MTRSQEIIADMKARDPAICFGGFPGALAQLSASRHLLAAARAIIPDGYRVRQDQRQVVIYEVADTNPIRPPKAEKIAHLYDELEEIEWTLRVVVIDYTGHVVADVHGWAFGGDQTGRFAPANCLDMTPAARAAAIAAVEYTVRKLNQGEVP